LAAWSVLPDLHKSGKAGEDFLPLSKQKWGVGKVNNNSLRVQEGVATTPWVYLQGIVWEGLHVIHQAQEKVVQNGMFLDKKINSFLSWYVL
jgi:hypothetical protein